MEVYFNTKSIFGLIAKWKWHILIVSITAGVLGAVFSSPFFIHPKYKSTATVYPANIVCLSDESESEQMLELLQSNDIKFKIIEEFDLYKHYDIDSTAKSSLAKLMKIYDKNILIDKTPNDAINIVVVDEDPKLAADIANSIIKSYDNMVLALNSQKSHELSIIYKNEIAKKAKTIDSLSNILKTYRENYGLLDMKSQVRAYTEAASQGKNLEEARTVLGNWKEYGAEYQRVDSLLFKEISNYQKDIKIYEDAVRDMEKIQTYSHVISKPYASDKKVYPVRWLIVLFTLLGACLVSVVSIAIIEACKNKSKVETQD